MRATSAELRWVSASFFVPLCSRFRGIFATAPAASHLTRPCTGHGLNRTGIMARSLIRLGEYDPWHNAVFKFYSKLARSIAGQLDWQVDIRRDRDRRERGRRVDRIDLPSRAGIHWRERAYPCTIAPNPTSGCPLTKQPMAHIQLDRHSCDWQKGR